MADYEQAVALLPPGLGYIALALPENVKKSAEELRLRVGQPMTVSVALKEKLMPSSPRLTASDLAASLERCTRASLHSAMEGLKRGFISAPGGCRVGVCGTAAVQSGGIIALRDVSSLVIRIAREYRGIADPIAGMIIKNGRIQNTLIISPPGFGKTTLLRDLIRRFSCEGRRVAVADERGEIAGMENGTPAFDIGPFTDVMTGAPKASAAVMLLRTMTPEVVALDELTDRDDMDAARAALGCGSAVIATVHGSEPDDIKLRLGSLMNRGFFKKTITVFMENGKRSFKVEDI